MLSPHKTGEVVDVLLTKQDLYVTDNFSNEYLLFVHEKYDDGIISSVCCGGRHIQVFNIHLKYHYSSPLQVKVQHE